MKKIKKGLDIPISGEPKQIIDQGALVTEVAIVGFDYNGMKPTMEVAEGDRVQCGQLLFTDKKTEGVRYTSPATGTVKAIHRGEKRVFQSIVISVDQHEDGESQVQFAHYPADQLESLSRQQAVDLLVESGEWTAFRTRPFSKVPELDAEPHSIFVSVMDTQPLAADPLVIIAQASEDFQNGLRVLSRLTKGKVFVCSAPDVDISLPKLDRLEHETFSGPHPAGLVGTHIHHLDPVNMFKSVWTVGYQDVIAIGRLFTTGYKFVERVVALSGPAVKRPRLIRTRTGAAVSQLTKNELNSDNVRTVSGSVLGGRSARDSVDYLGRYDYQIACLEEGHHRELFGWLSPGLNKFSVINIYLSKLMPGKRFNMTTTTNGSERAMVPIGTYERIMPLDILPTQLLRALIVGDTEVAQKLGCLELDEEDLALCSFVCPGKYEYGPILRRNLDTIEKEG
ncbi:Na(+)-translocating NADH-quinone reductase subunit A [Allohahella marinimesophila]|uniref:Na(+)-translocating NADH-quinone reductase subunit A n=1 Tax=Allohahella marinimesophila TaxID=1054972 RepID=A0ABP7Q901_9GAMM